MSIVPLQVKITQKRFKSGVDTVGPNNAIELQFDIALLTEFRSAQNIEAAEQL